VAKQSSSERTKGKSGWKFRLRAPQRVKQIALLPTVLTLINGICGFYAIIRIAQGLMEAAKGNTSHDHFKFAAILILIAMVFDALDGRVARMTKTASNFGAQLDSLCDLVTFGVTPAFLVYAVSQSDNFLPARVLEVISILYLMCALIRLARFNVETNISEKSHLVFAGLPSPAAAGVIASAVIPWTAFPEFGPLHNFSEYILRALPIITAGLALLMVSRVSYIHLGNQFLRGVRPFVTLIELMLLALVLALLHEFALFLAFMGYALVGPTLWIKSRLLRKRNPEKTATKLDTDDTLF